MSFVTQKKQKKTLACTYWNKYLRSEKSDTDRNTKNIEIWGTALLFCGWKVTKNTRLKTYDLF